MDSIVRLSLRVEGIVQGVGFRPFVYSLAGRLSLAGWVGNDVDGVFAEVEGPAERVQEFLALLEADAPPLARVERVTATRKPAKGTAGFAIAASDASGRRRALVSPDSATCDDCLREMNDPDDRRFGYPFTNCTNCGPRFTIVTGVPYDRPLTTMAPFSMCAYCEKEYHDPANRRFHAQPVCCPECGPRLLLLGADGRPAPVMVPPEGQGAAPVPARAVLAATARSLALGQVVAVKGLGGYHLAVDARSEPAAAALRARKHRADKPFAVMVADLAAARQLAEVDETGEALLTSPQRPIVLLPRRPGAPLARAVAPGNRQLGIMLAYTPLHHLLLDAFDRQPIVLTSGNVSDEPIAYRDEDALARLAGVADAFLTHDRAIHIRTDDSVTAPFARRPMLLRRSRGYTPEPLTLAREFPRPVLACGAELKNTFCLGAGTRAFLSHHIGDLENYETLRSFTDGIAHFRQLFDIEPQVVAHDLHPEYLSTKYALDLEGVQLIGVQHHHAHIASCLADNDREGPVIGVAFDGTGYGSDGTIWGGEFLLAGLGSFQRAGHLEPVPLPGGAAAVRHPWRMAATYLDAAFGETLPARAPGLSTPRAGPGAARLEVARLEVARRNERAWAQVLAMARRGVNAPLTSSAGRLFDAVAALLGVRDTINYEGQAAIELEQLADPSERSPYPAAISDGPTLRVRGADLVAAAASDLVAGVAPATIAARFHAGVASVIAGACRMLRERSGLAAVALSGGVFQNLLLLQTTVGLLEEDGFDVLVHSRVPPGDGGISLGQAVIAAASDRAR